MSSASSARQTGDEAQQYLFWLWAARMLSGTEMAEVGFETGDFRAFDDVAARFQSPRPDGQGGFVDEEHVQAKFSVAGGKVLTGESLADPTLINATNISLLQRLRDAVDQAQREGRRCLFRLWSPWPVEPGSFLHSMIDTTHGALRLDRLFDGKTVRSPSGKLRKCWADNLGVGVDDEAELRRILRPLRIECDTRTLSRIRLELSDILPLAGLKPIADGSRADCYPSLIQRLHREGGRWFRPQTLIDACKHDGLWVGRPDIPSPATRIGIRTFYRFAEGLEDETDALACLSQYFTGRHIRDPQLWTTEILPRLMTFLGTNLTAGGRFRLAMPAVGSIAFTAGYLAEPKLGATFEIIQAGVSGTTTWQCGATDGETDLAWKFEVVDLGRTGGELAVAISATHTILEHVTTFVRQQLPGVGTLVHLALVKVGQDALAGGGHAFRAAQEAITLIAQHNSNLGFDGATHLFWAAPNGLTFMLGQLARALGPIVLYEFDFEGIGHSRYAASLALNPAIRLP